MYFDQSYKYVSECLFFPRTVELSALTYSDVLHVRTTYTTVLYSNLGYDESHRRIAFACPLVSCINVTSFFLAVLISSCSMVSQMLTKRQNSKFKAFRC